MSPDFRKKLRLRVKKEGNLVVFVIFIFGTGFALS